MEAILEAQRLTVIPPVIRCGGVPWLDGVVIIPQDTEYYIPCGCKQCLLRMPGLKQDLRLALWKGLND
jgi:hypothetical protein